MRRSVMFGILSVVWIYWVAVAQTQAAEPVEQRNYLWFTTGQRSGTQTVKVDPDGRVSVFFKFNDRGRGPDTTTQMRLDVSGALTEFSVTGVNYWKGAVEEHFEVREGVATWRSAQEQGRSPTRAGQMYLPVNQPPEYRAVLARALLGRTDRQVTLLPAGSARIEAVDALVLPVGGKSRTATLYAVSGIDLAPSHVWLDEDRLLVGYVDGWFAVLRDSWAEHLPKFQTAQDAAQNRHIRAQAERFRQQFQQPIAIVNARVLNVEAGRLTPPTTVLLRDGRIAEVGLASSAIPADAHRIEGGGRTLMPALWDMHGHISPDDYLLYVASGVLGVRDMGNDPGYLARAREQIAAGVVAAPDIYPMGFIDKRGPYSAPTGQLAQTLEEARGFIRSYADGNYVGIKLYSSIQPDWVPVLTEEARARQLAVAGHIPAFMSPEQAIRAGYSEVTHINMILLQLIGDWSVDSRTPMRFIVPGERGGLIDADGKDAKAFIDFMAERRIAHDPTLSIFMNQYYSRPGEPLPNAAAYVDHLPPSLRRQQIAQVSYNHGKEEAFRRTGEVALKLIKRLHERGVRILPGTDSSLPAFTLISELQYYAQAGIANTDILRLATLEAARYLGRDSELGSVTVGKKAYLILVDGDPTQDLSTLRKVDYVIKGNSVFQSQQILAALGIRPF